MDLFLLALDLSSQLQHFSLYAVELLCIFEEDFFFKLFELLCFGLELVDLLVLLGDSVVYGPHRLTDIF